MRRPPRTPTRPATTLAAGPPPRRNNDVGQTGTGLTNTVIGDDEGAYAGAVTFPVDPGHIRAIALG